MSRKPISKRLRYAVLERDGYRCRYCGADASEAKLHVDHRTPVSAGGPDEFRNLLTACQDCNLGKHAFLPVREIPSQREMALALAVYMRAAEKFGAEAATYRNLQIIVDHCLSASEPEHFMRIVLDAVSWRDAYDEMFRYAGFPDPEEYWSDKP